MRSPSGTPGEGLHPALLPDRAPEGQVSPAAVDETCQGAVSHLWGLGPSAARAGVKPQPRAPGRWAPSTGVWLPVGSSIPTLVPLMGGAGQPPTPCVSRRELAWNGRLGREGALQDPDVGSLFL